MNKILDHINWLSSSENQELRDINEMGSWTLNTTEFNPSTNSGMAVELSEDLEKEKITNNKRNKTFITKTNCKLVKQLLL